MTGCPRLSVQTWVCVFVWVCRRVLSQALRSSEAAPQSDCVCHETVSVSLLNMTTVWPSALQLFLHLAERTVEETNFFLKKKKHAGETTETSRRVDKCTNHIKVQLVTGLSYWITTALRSVLPGHVTVWRTHSDWAETCLHFSFLVLFRVHLVIVH